MMSPAIQRKRLKRYLSKFKKPCRGSRLKYRHGDREPNPMTRYKYGDRSPECIRAYNEYMREYMRKHRPIQSR